MNTSNLTQNHNFSFRMRDEISNPYKTTGGVIVLCIVTGGFPA
jgi:hypothetical protein